LWWRFALPLLIENLLLALRDRRRAAGLSLRDVATRIGVSHVTLDNYERGMRTPSLDLLERYAEAVGMRLLVRLTSPETEAEEAQLLKGFRTLSARMRTIVLAMVASEGGES
jgi:transcriptional regulator with XRE-family HTH domain